jgi:hypothetical protein
MRLQKLLIGILTAGTALSAVPVLTGCSGQASYVVETDVVPPPPRHEVRVYRPGYIWVEGRWVRDRGDWRWRPGYYERERSGHVYVPGRWERRGRSYIYVEGDWRPRASVTVRGRI